MTYVLFHTEFKQDFGAIDELTRLRLKIKTSRYHEIPERTETDRNGPKRTSQIPKRTCKYTGTDRNGLCIYRNGLRRYRNGLCIYRNGPKRTLHTPERTETDFANTETDRNGLRRYRNGPHLSTIC